MLITLSDNEKLVVSGGADLAMVGRILTGTGTIFASLAAVCHAAGNPNDPKAGPIFTEHTANVITFILTCLTVVTSGVGTLLSSMAAEGKSVPSKKDEKGEL